MEKGTIIYIIFCILVIGLVAWIMASEQTKISSFCEDNGYDTYKRGKESYCIKQYRTEIIKKEIDTCNHRGLTLYDWCFVKVEEKV